MYSVQNEQFEGPLDLLLSLIEKEKLNITQISLSKITSAYLLAISEIDGDSSEMADFLVVASKLLYIKSRDLIPNAKTEEEEAEIADLEEKLREYQKYKEAAQHLSEILDNDHRGFSKRSKNEVIRSFHPPEELKNHDLYAIFNDAMNRVAEETNEQIEIEREVKISLEERIVDIKKSIKKGSRSSFRKLLGSAKTKVEVIVTFLAILEMIKQKEVKVEQDASFSDFVIIGLK